MSGSTAVAMESVFIGLPGVFSQLPSHVRQYLSSSARIVNASRNETLISLGEAEPPIIVVRTGLLAIQHPLSLDSWAVTEFINTQDVFINSVSAEDIASLEIVSVGASSVVCWPLNAFNQALTDSTVLSQWLLRYLTKRQIRNHFHRARISCLTLEAQLAFFYWSVSSLSKDGSKRVVTVKIPQHLLASYFDVTREEISRKKQLLEKAGYIISSSEGIELSSLLPIVFTLQSDLPTPWESLWPKKAMTSTT